MGSVPRDPKACAWCAREGGPCEHHRGNDGKATCYTGPDVYKPSDWVQSVVGGRYRGWRGMSAIVYLCTGYDPRSGFWMQDENDAAYRTNVSERAIDRTFHRVR